MKLRIIIIGLTLASGLAFTNCKGSDNGTGGIEAAENPIKKMINNGALVVDVRTPGEYSGGHYPKAVNIPLQQLPQRLDELGKKDQKIVLYCHSGGRSGAALNYLRKLGFENAVNAGGLRDMPR